MTVSYTFFHIYEYGPTTDCQDQLRDACCHLADMIEDIDFFCILDYELSDVALPNYFGR